MANMIKRLLLVRNINRVIVWRKPTIFERHQLNERNHILNGMCLCHNGSIHSSQHQTSFICCQTLLYSNGSSFLNPPGRTTIFVTSLRFSKFSILRKERRLCLIIKVEPPERHLTNLVWTQYRTSSKIYAYNNNILIVSMGDLVWVKTFTLVPRTILDQIDLIEMAWAKMDWAEKYECVTFFLRG